MNDFDALLPVSLGQFEGGPQLSIDARALHAALEVQTAFNDWISRRINLSGFKNGNDFAVILRNEKNPSGGRPQQDFILSIRMAKHLAMMERTGRGELVRDYFLACEERALASKPAPMSDDEMILHAMRVLDQRVAALRLENIRLLEDNRAQAARIEADKPKVAWADTAERAVGNILVGTMAKILAKVGYPIGMLELFKVLRNSGYLCGTGRRKNEPTQMALDLGVMTFHQVVVPRTLGDEIKRTPLITPKGQKYFVTKFLGQLPDLTTVLDSMDDLDSNRLPGLEREPVDERSIPEPRKSVH